MRYVRLHRYFSELLACATPPDVEPGDIVRVAYEEVRGHKGTDAAQIYGGVVAEVTRICETLAIPYRGIPVGTIKKRATGKGNAGKPAMVAAAQRQWPAVGDITDDEADALWCAVVLQEELTR